MSKPGSAISADKTCLRCRYWLDATGGDQTQGECHRWPPAGGESNFRADGKPRWPRTSRHDFCGEFSARNGWWRGADDDGPGKQNWR